MRRPFLRYYDLSRRQPVSAKSKERAHGFIYGSAYGSRVLLKQEYGARARTLRGEGRERGGVYKQNVKKVNRG